MKRINLFFAAVTAGMMALGHAGSAEAVIGKVNFVYNMPTYGYGYIMVQYPMAGSWAWSNTAPAICYYYTTDQNVLTQAAAYLANNVTVQIYGGSESYCPENPSAGNINYAGDVLYFFGMRNN